ncbi:MAG: FdhF/YdeP family oxidoreductase [Solirubrobacterales bacterium]
MLRKPTKLPTPSNWAGPKPFGIGEQHPNNFGEVFRAAWENRDSAGYAWRVLSKGVCDGCALGTSGLSDWTLPGVHLCNIRLRLLRLNTMGPLDPGRLADVEPLRGLPGAELRGLGRLPEPMVRRHGDPGFTPIGWEEALEIAAARIRATDPSRCGFFLTSRGMPNESYYAAQKAVRAIGTNSIDNAARICHSPSTFALKDALGVGATTCSYRDWIGTDLVVFIGSNAANNQPVAMKYLHVAKKAGTRVVVVNPFREPGMERYWIPSKPESALFGTKIADDFFAVNTGGDIAFLVGAMKRLIEAGGVDSGFVDAHTEGFDAVRAVAEAASWEELELVAGSDRERMSEFADLLAGADNGVLVWSMGVTQHERGEDNVRAIVNLALARGWIGRDGCGLMPIRGHSGVQGGAEMGCYSTAFPGGAEINRSNAEALSERWGFPVPAEPGMTAPAMVDAAGRGELDVLFASGGNFLDVLPGPEEVAATLARVPLRIHMDLVVSSQMLVDPPAGGEVLVLPAETRYEAEGGVTETSTERRVIFSPPIGPGRIPQARPEWDVFGELAARVRPEIADRVRFASTPEIREEIAATVPRYEPIAGLAEAGDSFQCGGPHLPAGHDFPTADGRAHFVAVEPPEPVAADGRFAVSTRRGKQFNSMVQERSDAITGAGREAVLMADADAERLGLADGDEVVLRSPHGELRCFVLTAPLAPGNLQVHWPEGNVLIGDRRSPQADVPDYNARVELVPA